MHVCRDCVLPWLTHLTMRQSAFVPYRARAVEQARGRVLEIGIGSGLNLPLYGPGVTAVVGLDPSRRLLDFAAASASQTAIPLELIQGGAEALPIESHSIDSVVTTWTMCSIGDLDGSLAEVRRVLKPDGSLMFVEHGRAPEPVVQWWQDRLAPAWRWLTGGCHLNRAIEDIVQRAGFRIDRLAKGYMRGPKAMTYMYEGQARQR